MKVYDVNFDFEIRLANPKLAPNPKINREFEYVFFFINKEDCALVSYTSYEQEYLNYLDRLELTIPKFVKDKSNPWWGNPEKENSLALNSKVFSSKLAVEYEMIPESFEVLSSAKEVEEKRVDTNKYLLRSDLGFSGKGHLFIDDQTPSKKIEKFFNQNDKAVFSPVLNRVLDFGVTIDLVTDSFYIVENINHPSGSFRGGRFFKDIESFKTEYGFIDSDKLLEAIRWNKETAKSNGATEYIQVDMFYYEGNGIELCSHVEWNYRKTMGTMLKALNDLSQSNYTTWVIVPKNKIGKDLVGVSYEELSSSCVVTSPKSGHYFYSFAIKSDSKSEHDEKLLKTLAFLEIADEFTQESFLLNK